MGEKILLSIMALLPFLSGCFALVLPHKFDEYAKQDQYRAIRGIFIFRILPTAINVWFIRLIGIGGIYLGCWLAYMIATK